ncbi:hypothetical protein HDV06_002274 [Boothiomyces sp. JEL0866]|nr:hypothetical protein HDV06_002274 [Boothiomyces sp. JEL0866]
MEDKKENAVESFDESYWIEFLSGCKSEPFSSQKLVPNSDQSRYEMKLDSSPNSTEGSIYHQISSDPEINEDPSLKWQYPFNVSMQLTPIQRFEIQQSALRNNIIDLQLENQTNVIKDFDAFIEFDENWINTVSNYSTSQSLGSELEILNSEQRPFKLNDEFSRDSILLPCNLQVSKFDSKLLPNPYTCNPNDYPGARLLHFIQNFDPSQLPVNSTIELLSFLCPQPCVYLIGDGWDNVQCITKIVKIDKDSFRELESCCSTYGQETKLSIKFPLEIACNFVPEILNLKNIGVSSLFPDNISLVTMAQFSKLYIADMDKQRSFALKFTVTSSHKTFNLFTKEIKVISKPPTLVPERDGYGLHSGDYVSLFNRINCQSGSTRFLDVTNNILSCNELKWGLFRIWLQSDLEILFDQLEISIVNTLPEKLILPVSLEHTAIISEFLKHKSRTKSELIEYGDVIILEHVESGKISIPFKVGTTKDESQKGYKKCKSGVNKDKKERQFYTGRALNNTPISQLQKIALSIAHFPDLFLCQKDDEIMLFTSTNSPQGFALLEQCIWTVVGTEVLDNGFTGITNIPIFTSIEMANDDLVLNGNNFTGEFWMFFGGVPARKVKIRESTIIMKPTHGISLALATKFDDAADENLEEKVPLLMVFESGIVFHTGFDVFLSLFY